MACSPVAHVPMELMIVPATRRRKASERNWLWPGQPASENTMRVLEKLRRGILTGDSMDVSVRNALS